ncbi:MAG TPA: RNA-binding protein [Gammaproteobacteria bacterium]|nr:RNA-binding protein [Gammaproteobacteria bacterium]
MPGTENAAVRLDKWLWAARFYKTRALAVEAIKGGHVHLNGHRVKPSRKVEAGDALRIRKGEDVFQIAIRDVSDKRGPATRARQLYEETPRSIEARERQRAERRVLAAAAGRPAKRPDKRARRRIIRFINKHDQPA